MRHHGGSGRPVYRSKRGTPTNPRQAKLRHRASLHDVIPVRGDHGPHDGRMAELTMATGTKTEIRWLASLDEALELSRQRDKPVLLDFFSPT